MNDLLDIDIKDVIKAVETQERLQEFVYCLYTNKEYKLSKLKSLDSHNFKFSMYILRYVYPENPFGNINRFE